MKNIFLIIISAFIISSCTKGDYLKYDTSKRDAIYFNITNETDSVFYNFGFTSIDSYTISVPIKVMGTPKSYARMVKVASIESLDSTTISAKDSYYTLPTDLTVEANAVETTLEIVLKRDAELIDTTSTLIVTLVENDDFTINGITQYKIVFDDKNPIVPSWWSNSTDFLGSFTRAKYEKFLEFFWAIEGNPLYTEYYEYLIDYYGVELNEEWNGYYSPFKDYPYMMKREVQQKLYDYQQANPSEMSGVKAPVY